MFYKLSHLSSTILNVCLQFLFTVFILRAKVLSHIAQTDLKFVIYCLGYWDYKNMAPNVRPLLDCCPGFSLETSSMTQGVQFLALQPSPTEVHAGITATHHYARPLCWAEGGTLHIKQATSSAQHFNSVCNLYTLYIL